MYFSRDLDKEPFLNSSQIIWRLTQKWENVQGRFFCRFDFFLNLNCNFFPEMLHSHVNWNQLIVNHRKSFLLRKIVVSERHNFHFQFTCEWSISETSVNIEILRKNLSLNKTLLKVFPILSQFSDILGLRNGYLAWSRENARLTSEVVITRIWNKNHCRLEEILRNFCGRRFSRNTLRSEKFTSEKFIFGPRFYAIPFLHCELNRHFLLNIDWKWVVRFNFACASQLMKRGFFDRLQKKFF